MLGALTGSAQAKRRRRVHPISSAAASASGAETEAGSTSATPAVERASTSPALSKNPCVAAFQGAQEHEQAGQLAAAKELWLRCARATCGSFLKQECTTRYTQLETDIPSVVPVVTDESGAPRVDVQVRIDGELVATQLDGRALSVDPGMHEFSFSMDGNVIARQKLMILQGQRNRQIAATLRAAGGKHAAGRARTAVASIEKVAPETEVAATKIDSDEAATSDEKVEARATRAREGREERAAKPPRIRMEADTEGRTATKTDDDAGSAASVVAEKDEPPGPSHALSYALGGAGLAGIGAGALMIYWGRKDNDLLGSCSPGCPPGAVGHIRNMYLAGDIALGVGVASLAASYLVFALSHTKEEKATQDALLWHVAPTSSGAVAGVSGSF